MTTTRKMLAAFSTVAALTISAITPAKSQSANALEALRLKLNDKYQYVNLLPGAIESVQVAKEASRKKIQEHHQLAALAVESAVSRPHWLMMSVNVKTKNERDASCKIMIDRVRKDMHSHFEAVGMGQPVDGIVTEKNCKEPPRPYTMDRWEISRIKIRVLPGEDAIVVETAYNQNQKFGQEREPNLINPRFSRTTVARDGLIFDHVGWGRDVNNTNPGLAPALSKDYFRPVRRVVPVKSLAIPKDAPKFPGAPQP